MAIVSSEACDRFVDETYAELHVLRYYKQQHHVESLIARLFGRELRATTLLLSLLWFSANFASGWWTWMPEFAKLQHLPAGHMYVAVTVARVVAMVAFLLAALTISVGDVVDRKFVECGSKLQVPSNEPRPELMDSESTHALASSPVGS